MQFPKLCIARSKMAARGAVRKLHEIFVSRLPWTAGAAEVKEYFSQFGVVRSCRLNYDLKTGFSKGYAFVAFQSDDSLRKAVQVEQHVIDGQKVGVQERQDAVSTNRLRITEILHSDSDGETV